MGGAVSRRRAAGTALGVAAVVTVLWLLRFDTVNIVVAAAAAAVLGGLIGHRDLGADLAWPALADEHRGGHRHEVAHTSWSLTTREGRISDHGLRRLRTVAAGRLRLAGIDPEDDAAVTAAIGARGLRTLRATASTAPTMRDLDACLTALDTLEGATHDT